MIIAEFKLDCYGLGTSIETIGSVKIINTGDHPHSPKYGNYKIVFTDDKNNQEIVVLENHLREDGFWVLLERAIHKKLTYMKKVKNAANSRKKAKLNGTKLGRKKKIDDNKIWKLYTSGTPCKDIAKQLNISLSSVHVIIRVKKRGI